jgi:protein-disulfide isomerase
MLFSGQKDWSDLADPTDTFVAYATQIGLNIDQFKTDLTSSAVKDAIAQDVRGGNSANVDSTPTFFLNGLQITSNPQGLAPFMTLIDAALNPAPAATDSADTSTDTSTAK